MQIKKTMINIGYSCNNRCIFCYNENKRNCKKYPSTKEIINKINLSRLSEKKDLEFIGGEPTIRKDFLKIIKFAKKSGFKTIKFTTNGRMLSNYNYAKKIIEAGANNIIFSIHGNSEILHDSLTRSNGSFKEMCQGIDNLKKIGFKNIESNTVIVKQNYKNLPKIAEMISNLGINKSNFIFVNPNEGGSKTNYFEIVPTYEETSKYINKTLNLGIKKGIKNWHIKDFPLCFINKENQIYINKKHKEKKSYNTEKFKKSYITKCRKCNLKNKCKGYWNYYIQKYCLKQIRLELTYECNKKCNFCYNNNYQKDKEYFSATNFKKLLNSIKEDMITEIRFTGGEPTLHPNFLDFIKKSHEKKLKIIVNTNGTLFKKYPESLKFIDKVIYSANDIENADFAKEISKKCKSFEVNTVLTKENIELLDEYYKRLNIYNWNLLRNIPSNIDNELDEKDIIKLFSKLEKYDKRIFIDNLFPFCGYKPEIVKKYIRENGVCNGRNTLIMSSKGKLRVCNSINEEIGEFDLINSWNSKFAKSLRNLKLIPKICKRCKYLEKCKGGCRYTSKLKFGNYNELDSLAKPDIYLEADSKSKQTSLK